jgi:hypothetical protein
MATADIPQFVVRLRYVQEQRVRHPGIPRLLAVRQVHGPRVRLNTFQFRTMAET